ncbi:hypothetical protein GmHk_01G000963 [Glycine max]|nr:hypothetical protein GmHk_01G000963 [Glycine max]
METLQKVRKAWEVLQKKDKELRGSNNGPIGGYRKWLKAHVQGLDWLPSLRTAKREEVEAPEEDEEVQALRKELKQAQTVKERFKSAALKIRKENTELRDVNVATTKVLERETKRACREEHGRNKFRGALWGSNNKLKLRREERDQSRVDSLILKDELKACSRSKRSLSQRLCETETNMLAIISKYQEELNLAIAHEHKVADEYARVYAEKEARGRVIDSSDQEATMWMNRFALTLNGSQELPRLLAKAKAMVDTYSAPEEIHGLLNYSPTFGAHFCSKSRKEGIFGVVKRISTCGTSKFQIVMAAQLIHDRVEMECLEGAWETLEGNTRCRFRGTIRFTATSLVHPDEPARTLQRIVEWILPTPTPYRLVEPVQVIEVTSSEEDPEEDLEDLPPEPAVDALDFLEGDEDPLPEVDSPEDVMSASEANSTEDSGPGEMAISGGSSS